MNKKSKVLSRMLMASLGVSLIASPLVQNDAVHASTTNDQRVNTDISNSDTLMDKAVNYITADPKNKMYHFNEQSFKNDTNAPSKEVEKIKSNVNQINQNVQDAKHVTVENGELVTYIYDDEINQELEKQGLKEKKDSSNNKIVTEAAKKGGVTKVTYGKKGKVNLYISHGALAAVAKAGGSGAAGTLGYLVGGGLGGFIGSAASYIVGTYGGKAIPKNGIIIKGKVDGSIQKIVKQ